MYKRVELKEKPMKTRIIISIFIHLILINSVFSQWTQTDGPYGTTKISAIFKNKTSIYTGTSCGLHQTDIVSNRWNYIANIKFDVYSQKGDSLFFGDVYNGIKFLDLSNASSEPKSIGLNSLSINAIKHTDNCLLAGVKLKGFCKSIGFSDQWEFFNKGLPVDSAYDTTHSDGSGGIYYIRYVNAIETSKGKLFCGTNKGVYISDLVNISWQVSNTGIPEENINLLKVINDTVYACTDNKVFWSSNSGDFWNELYTTSSKISSIYKYNNHIFLTTLGSGIYKSDDNGLAWNSFNNGLRDLNVNTLTYIDTAIVCGTLSTGIYLYNGTSWINNSKGIICSDIRMLKTANNSIIASNFDNIYLSNDGEIWNDISPNFEKKYFGSIATKGDTIFLSYNDKSWYRYIRCYSIKNNKWFYLINDPPIGSDYTPYGIFADNNLLYATEYDKMYYTNNMGLTWNDISLPSIYCNQFYGLISYNSVLFASACGNAQLIKLVNNNWELSNTGLPTYREITHLAKTSNALYAFVNYSGMYISKDNGNSWSIANNGLDSNFEIRSSTYKDENLFISNINGVFYTSNYGKNWNSLNDGLINKQLSSLVIKNDTLFVGTVGNGIWKRDINSIPLSINNTKDNLESLSFYPNPASDFVTIQTSISDKYIITITDILGRQILSKENTHNEPIDISGISNGLYNLRLNSINKILTGKLIIKK